MNPVFLSMLMAVLLLAMLYMRTGPGINQEILDFGKSRAHRFVAVGRTTTFADVAGIDEAKQELEELVDFLKHPWRFTALHARMPRGVLLSGPPGTGKTLLARAIAGEARVPFYSLCGSEFVEMVSGVGASRVRDLFDQAKASAPCIIFIDEIDAVGRMRGFSDADEEREQTLNQILVAMDGFDSSTNVVVIAATNRADLLDPALVRPGRFDRRIVLSPPDVIGRERILQVHARGHPLNPSVDLAELARVTDGLSGADLANVMNEAAILAVRRNLRTIDNPELEDALDRVMAGMQQARCAAGEHDRALMAIHEAGRALVGHYLPLQTQQFRFTLAPHRWREQALGERELHATRREVTACLTVTLAGRAAEDLVFGEGSTLSEHDIRAATSLAHHLVCACGMSGELGNLALEQNTDYSEITAEAIDREVRRFMEDAAAESRAIIVRHRGELDGIAQALLKREIITTAEVTELCAPIDCATSD